MADIMTASNSPRFPETVAIKRRSKSQHGLVAPLCVPPLEAARLLSLGLSHVYTLMRNGELEAFSSGRARRVTTKSIQAYVARQLAKADAKACNPAAPRRLRRGRQQRKRA
jgi:excisionase family DNA binding protein